MNLRDQISCPLHHKELSLPTSFVKRLRTCSQFDSGDTVMVARTHRREIDQALQSGIKPEVRVRRFLAFVVIVSFYLFGAATQALAAAAFDEKAVADFYRGKTVRIIVGFSAGGGYDAYSRLIGRHLQKHIPGNPSVLVDNMAGAGSIIAANHVYNAAPKDGTVIGNISGQIILEQLFGNPAVQYDLGKFR